MSKPNPVGLSDGMFIHAASVIVSDGALLFLGHSGAGKSTLCQLLAKQYPTLLDDLCLLMRSDDGLWYVHEPKKLWEGDSVSQVPLRAVLRIFQSPAVQLSRISPRDTCGHLMDGVFEVQAQQIAAARQKRMLFAYSAEISKQYNGWRLLFPIGSEVTEVIRKEFDSRSIIGNYPHSKKE